MKLLKISGILLAATLVLMGCSDKEETKTKEMVQIDKKELEKMVEASQFKEEAKYYRDYVRELTEKLTEEEKAKLIEQEWSYEIDVNGVKFPESGELEITAEELLVTVSEKRAPFSVLPLEESIKGKIFQALNHSVVMNGQEMEMETISQTETEHVITFAKEKVTSGDVFMIELQEDVAERLGVKMRSITIRIR
ncbi:MULTISPECIES: hypothetical protein [unclassified Psychrobacillus]|uniref:hypothetical protein n=1 Tax=unclassified Psychrobacillus TaxID=2636677 RepID=UPI0030F51CC4